MSRMLHARGRMGPLRASKSHPSHSCPGLSSGAPSQKSSLPLSSLSGVQKNVETGVHSDGQPSRALSSLASPAATYAPSPRAAPAPLAGWGYTRWTEKGGGNFQPPPPGWTPQWQPETDNLPSSDTLPRKMISVTGAPGSRHIHMNLKEALNTLNPDLLRGLRRQLNEYEHNPAVECVVLSGADSNIFCSGSDYKNLWQAIQDKSKRENVHKLLREQYELMWLLKTYTKPVVAAVDGVALGSGYGIASHANYPYATENTTIAVPEVTVGLVPNGGVSYYLSRLKNGVGMYMGLTGAALRGEEAYWAGLAPHYATSDMVHQDALEVTGEPHREPFKHWELESDWQYKRSLKQLREDMPELKYQTVVQAMPEDANEEELQRFLDLNTWYTLYSSGHKHMADMFLEHGYNGIGMYDGPESRGKFLDFFARDEVEGRETPSKPTFLDDEERRALSAMNLHIRALNMGAVPEQPSREVAHKLAAIKRSFAGDPDKADPVYLTVEPSKKESRSRLNWLAGIAGKPWDKEWEQKLSKPLAELLKDVYVRLDTVPARNPHVHELLTETVRVGVYRAWPFGMLDELALDKLCMDCGLPDDPKIQRMVAEGIIIATSKFHQMPSWPLRHPWIVARDAAEKRWAKESKAVYDSDDGERMTSKLASADPMYNMGWEDVHHDTFDTYLHPDYAVPLTVTHKPEEVLTTPPPVVNEKPWSPPESRSRDVGINGGKADQDLGSMSTTAQRWRTFIKQQKHQNTRNRLPQASASYLMEGVQDDLTNNLDELSEVSHTYSESYQSMLKENPESVTFSSDNETSSVNSLGSRSSIDGDAEMMHLYDARSSVERASDYIVKPDWKNFTVHRREGDKFVEVNNLEEKMAAVGQQWEGKRPYAGATILGGAREAALSSLGQEELHTLHALNNAEGDERLGLMRTLAYGLNGQQIELTENQEYLVDAVLEELKHANALHDALDYGASGAVMQKLAAGGNDLKAHKFRRLQEWIARIRATPADEEEALAWRSIAMRILESAETLQPTQSSVSKSASGKANKTGSANVGSIVRETAKRIMQQTSRTSSASKSINLPEAKPLEYSEYGDAAMAERLFDENVSVAQSAERSHVGPSGGSSKLGVNTRALLSGTTLQPLGNSSLRDSVSRQQYDELLEHTRNGAPLESFEAAEEAGILDELTSALETGNNTVGSQNSLRGQSGSSSEEEIPYYSGIGGDDTTYNVAQQAANLRKFRQISNTTAPGYDSDALQEVDPQMRETVDLAAYHKYDSDLSDDERAVRDIAVAAGGDHDVQTDSSASAALIANAALKGDFSSAVLSGAGRVAQQLERALADEWFAWAYRHGMVFQKQHVDVIRKTMGQEPVHESTVASDSDSGDSFKAVLNNMTAHFDGSNQELASAVLNTMKHASTKGWKPDQGTFLEALGRNDTYAACEALVGPDFASELESKVGAFLKPAVEHAQQSADAFRGTREKEVSQLILGSDSEAEEAMETVASSENTAVHAASEDPVAAEHLTKLIYLTNNPPAKRHSTMYNDGTTGHPDVPTNWNVRELTESATRVENLPMGDNPIASVQAETIEESTKEALANIPPSRAPTEELAPLNERIKAGLARGQLMQDVLEQEDMPGGVSRFRTREAARQFYLARAQRQQKLEQSANEKGMSLVEYKEFLRAHNDRSITTEIEVTEEDAANALADTSAIRAAANRMYVMREMDLSSDSEEAALRAAREVAATEAIVPDAEVQSLRANRYAVTGEIDTVGEIDRVARQSLDDQNLVLSGDRSLKYIANQLDPTLTDPTFNREVSPETGFSSDDDMALSDDMSKILKVGINREPRFPVDSMVIGSSDAATEGGADVAVGEAPEQDVSSFGKSDNTAEVPSFGASGDAQRDITVTEERDAFLKSEGVHDDDGLVIYEKGQAGLLEGAFAEDHGADASQEAYSDYDDFSKFERVVKSQQQSSTSSNENDSVSLVGTARRPGGSRTGAAESVARAWGNPFALRRADEERSQGAIGGLLPSGGDRIKMGASLSGSSTAEAEGAETAQHESIGESDPNLSTTNLRYLSRMDSNTFLNDVEMLDSDAEQTVTSTGKTANKTAQKGGHSSRQLNSTGVTESDGLSSPLDNMFMRHDQDLMADELLKSAAKRGERREGEAALHNIFNSVTSSFPDGVAAGEQAYGNQIYAKNDDAASQFGELLRVAPQFVGPYLREQIADDAKRAKMLRDFTFDDAKARTSGMVPSEGPDGGVVYSDAFKAALTHDPETIVRAFGLPRTPDTLGTAERVASYYKHSDASRFAVSHPHSVEEIYRRLRSEDTPFARDTIRSMDRVSPLALKATHRLLVWASSQPYDKVIRNEWRAMTRLTEMPDFDTAMRHLHEQQGLQSGTTPTWSHASLSDVTPEQVHSLFAPLNPADELAIRTRKKELGMQASQRRALRKWYKQMARYYESGLAGGPLGEMFARRYTWDYELNDHLEFATTAKPLPSVVTGSTEDSAAVRHAGRLAEKGIEPALTGMDAVERDDLQNISESSFNESSEASTTAKKPSQFIVPSDMSSQYFSQEDVNGSATSQVSEHDNNTTGIENAHASASSDSVRPNIGRASGAQRVFEMPDGPQKDIFVSGHGSATKSFDRLEFERDPYSLRWVPKTNAGSYYFYSSGNAAEIRGDDDYEIEDMNADTPRYDFREHLYYSLRANFEGTRRQLLEAVEGSQELAAQMRMLLTDLRAQLDEEKRRDQVLEQYQKEYMEQQAAQQRADRQKSFTSQLEGDQTGSDEDIGDFAFKPLQPRTTGGNVSTGTMSVNDQIIPGHEDIENETQSIYQDSHPLRPEQLGESNLVHYVADSDAEDVFNESDDEIPAMYMDEDMMRGERTLDTDRKKVIRITDPETLDDIPAHLVAHQLYAKQAISDSIEKQDATALCNAVQYLLYACSGGKRPLEFGSQQPFGTMQVQQPLVPSKSVESQKDLAVAVSEAALERNSESLYGSVRKTVAEEAVYASDDDETREMYIDSAIQEGEEPSFTATDQRKVMKFRLGSANIRWALNGGDLADSVELAKILERLDIVQNVSIEGDKDTGGSMSTTHSESATTQQLETESSDRQGDDHDERT